jgi:hypothetical protein
MLAASKPDALVAITVEHWANFFLNHMPAFCIGRADHYEGPVEDLPMSRSCPGRRVARWLPSTVHKTKPRPQQEIRGGYPEIVEAFAAKVTPHFRS